jgi:uncharacterized membrane protein
MKMNRLFRAGLVLGAGFGGFFDGIVLHQILGWHHLVCRTETCRPLTIGGLQQQTMEDGFFHLAVWVISLVGVGMLFNARDSADGRTLIGGMLAGWGAFNLIEGLIDHQLLGLHHVRPDSPHWFLYDMLFLASGVVLIVIGRKMSRPKTVEAQP